MKRLPSWPVLRLRLFAAVTIGSAAAISFDSIRHLAEVAGFGTFAWLFPATLDAVAAYGMDLWVRRSPAAGPAKWLALSAIGGSLVANVVDHWLTQHAVLGAVLGAVPPAMLAALLAVAHRHATGTADQLGTGPDHAVPIGPMPLWSMVQFPDGTRVPETVVHGLPETDPEPAARIAVVPDLGDGAPVVQRSAPRRRTSAARVAGTTQRTARLHSDEDIRVWIKQQAARPTKATVMGQFHVGSSKALRLINDAKGPISDG